MQDIHHDLEQYDTWLSEHFEELVAEYPRKVIAVIGNEIIAIGENEKELYRLIRKKYPGTTPFIFTVPSKENLVCL